MTRKAAIIGGGVIGGGWAARFLLNGWDVAVFDPDPEAPRKVGEVIANARKALPALSDVPMPPEGNLSFAGTITEAVDGAEYIQESVSERLDLKHRVFAQIQQVAPGVLIGSSTSGFKPSELQENAPEPGMIFVAHPFNPVYLLPLAEVVPSPKKTPRPYCAKSACSRYMSARKSTPISPTVSLRPSGARRCGWSRTASPPPKKSTRRSAWALACAGARWGCLKPIASPAARRA